MSYRSMHTLKSMMRNVHQPLHPDRSDPEVCTQIITLSHLFFSFQARVDAQLNDRKRKAMEELNLALTSSKPQPKKILRSVISYVKAEEKDRIHIINR